MAEHSCRAAVLFCMDFRLHKILDDFLAQEGLDEDRVDVIRIAGSAKHLARPAVARDRGSLFEYINGGAELYLSYGFERLISAFYQLGDDEEKSIVLDIYDMGTPLQAYGVFGANRREEADRAPGGVEGFDWVWLILALLADIASWGVSSERRRLPGYDYNY